MKILHPNEYGTLNESRLQEFENEIDCVLPVDYREFLLENNGGKPMPDTFSYKNANGGQDTNSIRTFNGIHDDEYTGIHKFIDCYQGRLPNKLLPIADDELGNLICLGIKGKQKDKIYFWDHELEGTKKCLTLLSNSFSEFINSLFEWEDPNESYVNKIIKRGDLQNLKMVLNNGYNIEKTDEYGYSMLQYATLENQLDIVKYLVGLGAQLKDSLEIANTNYEFETEYKEMVDYLESVSN